MIIFVVIVLMCAHQTQTQSWRHLDLVTVPSLDHQRCPLEEGLKQIRENIRAVISIKEQCGAGVWYRVGYLNMSNPSQHCPTTWREYNISGVRVCG